METSERLVSSIDEASWLPPGSRAEAWAGPSCASFERVILVRLLLVRRTARGYEFFTVATPRGDDLPTLRPSDGSTLPGIEPALSTLLRATIGHVVEVHCVGFIRNVVPDPDDSYTHPTPHAHVPVFAAPLGTRPTVHGQWHTLDDARPALAVRHWWPIIAHALTHADSVLPS